jgi:hypothetical protein
VRSDWRRVANRRESHENYPDEQRDCGNAGDRLVASEKAEHDQGAE